MSAVQERQAPTRHAPVVRPALLRTADALRLVLLAGLAAGIVAGDGKAIVVLGAGATAALVLRFAMLPAVYDLTVVAALVLQCGGEALGLYDAWGGFDTLVHVTLPALTAPAAYLALARLEVVRDLRDPHDDLAGRGDVGVFVVTACVGLAIGGVWELAEGLSDGLAGSSLQESVGDTNRDLLADGIGSMLGAAGLVAWSRLGPGTVARTRDGRELQDA
ncbi:MAG TPA: hypothetical protein VD931_08605 [Baekduia sp.]|nr:hypothetical protein [Baekduia sp.]